MKIENDIFSYVRHQEKMYELPIRLNNSWDWGMKEHIELTTLYTNSQTKTGKDDFTPVKNITLPILNLQHRTEDIEMKDVQIYVNDADSRHLSFLIKKYHDDVFVRENDLDTFFDELNVSRIDYGAGLSKATTKGREVVHLQSIAFCDQTDILSGPIGIEHYYSPDQLLDMKSVGWGEARNGATSTVERLIELSREEKKDDSNGQITQTPGRYIKIYEVHGNLPKQFADPFNVSGEYETRLFIVAFYTDKNQKEEGIILYTAPETKSPFKLVKRDPIYGRALGRGGAEELFEPQVWTNYAAIRKIDMLDAASKTILKTTDATFANKNKMKDMENLEIAVLQTGTDLNQIDTFPRNMALFDRFEEELYLHAKDLGASQDPIQGKEPSSGTPFASLQAQIVQGLGLHEYRRGQFAKHIEDIYNEDFIPRIKKEIMKGVKFLSELSLDELQFVADAVTTNQTNRMVIDKILNGELITQQEIDAYKQQALTDFQKKGNKHLIEILKGEFKDAEFAVKVSVAGKSKNLAMMVDKLTNVFRAIIANPYILQSPPIAKLFNKIIEASGLDPIDLSQLNIPSMPARRMTETVDYKDLATPPNDAQTQMLKLAGIEIQQPIQPTQ